MKIGDILAPKSFSAIRHDVPARYRYAMIEDTVFDLKSEEKFKLITNNGNGVSDEAVFNMIVKAYRKSDVILTESEIFYGSFHFRDYIVLSELFNLSQKWDTYICGSVFNGETELFELHIVNTSLKESYRLSTKDLSFRDRILAHAKDLELVKLHLAFESLGGKHEIPSRFIDLVQRAGWDNGIKIIKAFLNVLIMLQESGKIGRKGITTKMSDHIQTDDHDIIYKFSTVREEYQLFTRHLIEEDTTSVRIFDKGNDESAEVIFEW